MDSRQIQTHHDANKSSSQIGKIYWSRCEDNPNYFRTVRIARNPMTGNIQPQISNITPGNPPPDMDEIPPLMKRKLLSTSNALPYT